VLASSRDAARRKLSEPRALPAGACGTPLELRPRILRLIVQAVEVIVQAVEAEVTAKEGHGEVLCRAMDLGSDK
jgi:hypothetical protein